MLAENREYVNVWGPVPDFRVKLPLADIGAFCTVQTQTCGTTTRVFWLRMVEEVLLGGALDPWLRARALASSVPC